MKVIAVANQKGGVAKTTTTYNLACAKAMEGKTVVMIDLDPQASLTILCGIEPGTGVFEKCKSSALFNKVPAEECAENIPGLNMENLFLIASDIDLAETEMYLFTKASREKQLKRALRNMGQYCDYIFIDCPPQLGILTINALVAADEVIVPCKTEYLAYRGLKALHNTIRSVQEDEDLNPDLKEAGVIVTFYEKNVNDQRDIREALEENYQVLGVIRKAADVYKDIVDGKPVVLARKSSDVAKVYIDIAKSI